MNYSENFQNQGSPWYFFIVADAIIQEMKMLLQNNSVAGDIVASLQGFPRSQNLSQMIMYSVKGAIFNDLMDFAIKMEFGGISLSLSLSQDVWLFL